MACTIVAALNGISLFRSSRAIHVQRSCPSNLNAFGTLSVFPSLPSSQSVSSSASFPSRSPSTPSQSTNPSLITLPPPCLSTCFLLVSTIYDSSISRSESLRPCWKSHAGPLRHWSLERRTGVCRSTCWGLPGPVEACWSLLPSGYSPRVPRCDSAVFGVACCAHGISVICLSFCQID
jgi:hypothetical protein